MTPKILEQVTWFVKNYFFLNQKSWLPNGDQAKRLSWIEGWTFKKNFKKGWIIGSLKQIAMARSKKKKNKQQQQQQQQKKQVFTVK